MWRSVWCSVQASVFSQKLQIVHQLGKVCGFIPAQLVPRVAALMPGFPDGQGEILRTHCLMPFSAAVTFLFPHVTLVSCFRSFPWTLLLLFLVSLRHHPQ